MKREMGHFQIHQESLPEGWTPDTLTSIQNIFKISDKTKHPILVVLPPESSPASVAVIASLLFLPYMREPPTPHCKIALAPGRHFIEDLRHVVFKAGALNRSVGKARVTAEYKQVPPSLMKLNKLVKKNPNDEVSFHWIWRCDRVWDFYNRIQRDELVPRNYFGRGDEYQSVIDIVESDSLERNSVKNSHYDLLLYCPFYHRVNFGEWPERLEHVSQVIQNFNADRKVIVVRSPYDYWARQLEDLLEAPGFTSVTVAEKMTKPVEIKIIETCLTIQEAKILYKLIQQNWKNLGSGNRKVIHDLHQELRKSLVSLMPFDENVARESKFALEEMFSNLDLDLVPKGSEVANKVIQWVATTPKNAKLNYLFAEAESNPLEVWVTRSTDRKSLKDECTRRNIEIDVRLTDRRMQFLRNRGNRKAILSRVDRESDLDWVSHLGPGDSVVMSTWEAVTRAWTIERLWERSEEWRTNSEKVGGISDGAAKEHDPVLTLADVIINLIKLSEDSEEKTYADISEDDVTEYWWDELYRRNTTLPVVDRASIPQDEGGMPCRELRFEDNTGIYLKSTSEVQVYREEEGDSEILTVSIVEVMEGDVAIIPKDSERGNILDVIMEHLEKSPSLGRYAGCVTKWKDSLRSGFYKKNISINEVRNKLVQNGGNADPVTIRSWIFGSIMAPRDKENINALVKTLEINEIDFDLLDESLSKLRGIPRVIGKLLNQFITEKDLDPRKRRDLENLIAEAGVDPENIRSSVEIKKIIWIAQEDVLISTPYINQWFKSIDI